MPDFGLTYYLPAKALKEMVLSDSLEVAIRDQALARGWTLGEFSFRVQSDTEALLDHQCPDEHRRVDLILRKVQRCD
jgi:hypothetical protein